MKFQTLIVLFAVTASAYSAPPTCKAQPSYCRYTSNKDARSCRQILAQNHISVARCHPPAKTITSTRIIRPTVIRTKTLHLPPITKKVIRYSTKTGKPKTQPTVTLTATSTEIETTTATDVTTATEFRAITKIETESNTVTSTTTSTSTSTSTIPYRVETTCARKRAIVFGRAAKQQFPASCSCFLTSTAATSVKTATVTAKKPAITRTVYKFGGPRKIITRTIIFTHYAAGPVLSAPETTLTTVTIITQTDRTLTTETVTEIETITETEVHIDTVTSTATATATTTVNGNPCDNPSLIKVSGGRSLSSPNVILQLTTLTDTQGCCRKCFSTDNCVFFRSTGNFCEIFSTRLNVLNQCTSQQCTRGKTPLIVGSSNGQDYYFGQCIGPQIV